MTFEALLFQGVDGLAAASGLFLVAAGLSLIFGVTRIINIAHGSLYMLGTYVAATIASRVAGGLGFWGGIVATAILIGLVGAAIEVVLLRRIYRAPELFQLLATFALVLVISDAVLWLWGPEDLLGPRAPGLRGAIDVLGRRLPSYNLFLIFVGPLVLLARLGGALQIAREPANLLTDLVVISDAFVVVVVGGMGSITGAYLAAVLISEIKALCISIGVVSFAGATVNFSKLTLVAEFLVMAVVLIARPYGLLGRPQAIVRTIAAPEDPIRPASTALKAAGVVVVIGLVLAPFLARNTPYALVLGIDVLIA